MKPSSLSSLYSETLLKLLLLLFFKKNSVSEISFNLNKKMNQLFRENTLLFGEAMNRMDCFNSGFATPRDGVSIPDHPATPSKLRLDPPTTEKKKRRGIPTESPLKRRNRSTRCLLGEGDSFCEVDGGLFLSQESRGESECFTRLDTQNSISFQLNHFQSTFTELKELGSGSFGRVVLAKHSFDHQDYAVKICKKRITSQADQHTKLRESRLLAKCTSCPFIVRYHNCWVDESQVFLQMEACKGGCVASYLNRTDYSRWCDKQLSRFVSQMCLALDHMHRELGLVHLDVKPGNIFISGSDYKLGDFGLAATQPNALISFEKSSLSQIEVEPLSQASVMSLEEGDGRYLPCDMLNEKLFPKEADIFSLGLSIYEIASGKPAPRANTKDWIEVRERGVNYSNLTQRGYEYLHKILTPMLSKEAGVRPQAMQVLQQIHSCWMGSSKDELNRKNFKPINYWHEIQNIMTTKDSPN